MRKTEEQERQRSMIDRGTKERGGSSERDRRARRTEERERVREVREKQRS